MHHINLAKRSEYMYIKENEQLLKWLAKLGLWETTAIISAQSNLVITPSKYFIELHWTYYGTHIMVGHTFIEEKFFDVIYVLM